MHSINKEPKKMFDSLTGIRAVAAYLVFFHHHNMFSSEKYGQFFHDFVNEFHIGVTVFFVLSGFLICYRYYDQINLLNRRWVLKYIQKRVARIYPMYFLLTTLVFVLLILQPGDISYELKLYLANITFIRGFFEDIAFTGISQGWSLTVEECFYFSAPFLFLATRRKYPVLYFLSIPLAGIALVLLFRHIDCYGFFGSFKFMFYYTYFGRCFEFFTGMFLALLFLKRSSHPGRAFGYWTISGIMWMLVCVSLLVWVKGDMKFCVYTPAGTIINNLVLPVGIAMLFWGLLTEESALKKILSTRLFVLLGKSSYTFYLIHQGIIASWIDKFLPHTLLGFVLLNMLSVLLFRLVEEPCNRLIRNM